VTSNLNETFTPFPANTFQMSKANDDFQFKCLREIRCGGCPIFIAMARFSDLEEGPARL
jgi:hypothetical protein